MKRAITNGCCMCPFSHGDSGPFLCVAFVVPEGTPLREIPMRHVHNLDARPPRWCPLRKQDHLVTLRVK